MANSVSILRRVLEYLGEGVRQQRFGRDYRLKLEDREREIAEAEEERRIRRRGLERAEVEHGFRTRESEREERAAQEARRVLERIAPGGDVEAYLAAQAQAKAELDRRRQVAEVEELERGKREPVKMFWISKGGRAVPVPMTDREAIEAREQGAEFADEPPQPRQAPGYAVAGQEGVFYPESGRVVTYPSGFNPVRPQGATAGERKDIALLDFGIKSIDRIEYMTRQLGGTKTLGSLLGRARRFSLANLGGEAIDPKVRPLVIALERFLRDEARQFGSQLTKTEYDFVFRTSPNANDTLETLIDKTNDVRRNLAEVRRSRLENMPGPMRDLFPKETPPEGGGRVRRIVRP